MVNNRHIDVRVRVVQSESPALYERLLAVANESPRAVAAHVRRLCELGMMVEQRRFFPGQQEPVYPTPAPIAAHLVSPETHQVQPHQAPAFQVLPPAAAVAPATQAHAPVPAPAPAPAPSPVAQEPAAPAPASAQAPRPVQPSAAPAPSFASVANASTSDRPAPRRSGSSGFGSSSSALLTGE